MSSELVKTKNALASIKAKARERAQLATHAIEVPAGALLAGFLEGRFPETFLDAEGDDSIAAGIGVLLAVAGLADVLGKYSDDAVFIGAGMASAQAHAEGKAMGQRRAAGG